jgi:hypothetical protein
MPSHTFAVTLFGSRAVFSGMQLAKTSAAMTLKAAWLSVKSIAEEQGGVHVSQWK